MRKTGQWIAAGLLVLAGGGAQAQERAEAQGRLVVAEPRIIAESLELVATGYTFTEGPAWDGARLIFSDIPGDTVYVYTPGEGAPKVLYTPSAMANGHTFDRQGRLLNAEHGSGTVTRWTPESGRQTVVATFSDRHLSSPNDVVVRSDGLILFTDPPYGLGTAYQGVQRINEIGFSGVYAFRETNGRTTLIDNLLERPNGLALSPDEKLLYVGDSATQSLWAYDIDAEGIVGNRRKIAALTDDSKPGRVDGVRVDSTGLIYVTCPGGICVVDPDAGTVIERLATPKRATNLAWGGPDLSELYITALGDVYRVKTRAQGIGSSSRAGPAR